jgi:hypothetical protein
MAISKNRVLSVEASNLASGATVTNSTVSIAPTSASSIYATTADLPLIGNTGGDQAFVQENNRLYLWNGSGWFNIALINNAPTITQAAAGSYSLAIDGTPTTISLAAIDSDGTPLTWSYSITTGSLGNIATISQDSSQFTITPSTDPNDAGSFGVTFSVTDGISTDTTTSTISLAFVVEITFANKIFVYDFATGGVPHQQFWKPDGTKLYYGRAGVDIRQVTLTTPWDLSTGTVTNVFTIGSFGGIITDDGLNIYYLTSSSVVKRTLSSAWDLSTVSGTNAASLTFNTVTEISAFGFTQIANVRGFFMDPTGTYMYTYDASYKNLIMYTLATPFDLSSTTATAKFMPANTDTGSIYFNRQGTQMFLAVSGGNATYLYNLSTPWDITTRSAAITTSVGSPNYLYSVSIDTENGLYLYTGRLNASFTDVITQYSVG